MGSGFVCTECIDESAIQEFIRENAVEDECSYCFNSSDDPIAADLNDVGKYMYDCLCKEYDDAANHLFYDSAEGGYIGEYWDTYDLLLDHLELELPFDHDGRLVRDLHDSIGHQIWCEARSINAEDRIRFSWDKFCEIVKTQRRFFFLNSEQGLDFWDAYSPQEMLARLFENAQHVNLLTLLPEGTHLFRARREGPNTPFQTAQELGPPPPEKAVQSNRMSPPGIVMFYACDDEETALLEVAMHPGRFAIGCFTILRSLTILDLTMIPPIPSIFESISETTEFIPRDALTFLHYVAEEISRPIERDDRVHVEYVPTQIVTEYIRSELTWGGVRVDGVKYLSSANPGHASYVLFATQDNLSPVNPTSSTGGQWLHLLSVKHCAAVLGLGK